MFRRSPCRASRRLVQDDRAHRVQDEVPRRCGRGLVPGGDDDVDTAFQGFATGGRWAGRRRWGGCVPSGGGRAVECFRYLQGQFPVGTWMSAEECPRGRCPAAGAGSAGRRLRSSVLVAAWPSRSRPSNSEDRPRWMAGPRSRPRRGHRAVPGRRPRSAKLNCSVMVFRQLRLPSLNTHARDWPIASPPPQRLLTVRDPLRSARSAAAHPWRGRTGDQDIRVRRGVRRGEDRSIKKPL